MSTATRILIVALLCPFIASSIFAQTCTGTYTLSASQPRCVGTSISFSVSDTSSRPYIYIWNWGDGSSRDTGTITSRSHSFSSTGKDTVWVVREDTASSAKCIDSISIIINVHSYPVAGFSFSPDSACSGTEIQFTDSSSGSGLDYEWSFNDGDSSKDKNPTHIFNAYGNSYTNYNVKLKVTNTGGCSNTTNHFVSVKHRPNLLLTDSCNYTNLSGYAGTGEQFKQCSGNDSFPSFIICPMNITLNPSSGITGYTILWGDGEDTSIGNVYSHPINHTYDSLGVYDLTYIATGSNGCTDTTIYEVVNETNPSVGIGSPGSTNGCRPKGFWFKLQASNVSPTTTFTWEFFDGTGDSIWPYSRFMDSVYHQYDTTSCGTYQTTCSNCFLIRVTAKNKCPINNTSASVDNIRIYSRAYPDFEFTPAVGCTLSTQYEFTNTSSRGTGRFLCDTIQSYLWDFGDGTTSTLVSPKHTYSTPGTYSIKLKIANTCGQDSIIKQITVNAYPTASFTYSAQPSTQCKPVTINFDDNSTGGDLMYGWKITPNIGRSFISGTSRDSANPIVRFDSAGVYAIQLRAFNNCSSDTAFDTIIVKKPPEVTITSIPDACQPHAFQPEAQIDSGYDHISIYRWTYSSGLPTDTISQPDSVAFAGAGLQWVKLFVENSCGNDSDSVSFKVFPLPVVDAGLDDSTCENAPLFNLTGFAPNGGQWTGEGLVGSNGTLYNPNKAGPGTDTIIYTVVDSNSCLNRDTLLITIHPKPSVYAGPNDTVCLDATPFTFTGNSPWGGYWLGIGITDSATGMYNPISAGPGLDTSWYAYIDSTTGCQDTSLKQILINSLPTVDAGVNDTVCFSDSPFNLSGSPAGGSWSGKAITNSVNGTFNPDLADTGTNIIVYSFTNTATGCSNSDTVLITVDIKPVANFTLTSDTAQCLGTNHFSFSNNSSVSSGNLTYQWAYGDGTDSAGIAPDKVYSTDSTYEIFLFAKSNQGCEDTFSRRVIVHSAPEADFSAPIICDGDSMVFTNTSTIRKGAIDSFLYYFKTTDSSKLENPKFLFDSAGVKQVRLIVQSDKDCIDSISKQVTIGHLPDAQFTHAQICLNDSTHFTDHSIINNQDTIVGWSWNFGDGGTSNAIHPSHQYLNDSSYWVELTVTSNNGCTDTLRDSIDILPFPIAGFTINNHDQCLNSNSFSFTNTSTFPDSLQYIWYFGNGDSSAAADSVYSYESSGTFQVKLIALANSGCVDSLVDTVYVRLAPIAGFVLDTNSLCLAGNTFSFTDTSTGATSYQWDFGDGSDTTIASPIKSYLNAGIFPISLIAANTAGCQDTARDTIVVRPMPIAAFTVDSGQCLFGNSFSFTNNSIFTDSLRYEWDLGDNTDTVKHPVHSYGKDSTYTIELIAITAYQCRDTAYDSIEVYAQPNAGMNFSNACFGDTIQFTSTTNISRDTFSMHWDFGDNDTSVLKDPAHYYDSAATYHIYLIATSTHNCIDTADTTISIYDKPVAGFELLSDSSQCFKSNLFSFNDTSIIKTGTLNYSWDFGDNTNSSDPAPIKQYSGSDTFYVKLKVSTGNACIDSIIKRVIVNPNPIASFTFDTACATFSTHFTDLTTLSSGSLASWNWHFSTNDSSDQRHPNFIFSTGGNYPVKLIASSALGCIDTIYDTVTVGYLPKAGFSASQFCLHDSTLFSDTSSVLNRDTILKYEWSFGDGDSSLMQNPNHKYRTEGNVLVKLQVTTNFGCVDSTSGNISLLPLPNASFSVNDSDQCLLDNEFIFSNNSSISSGTMQFLWQLGDGTTSTAIDTLKTYDSVKTYLVSLLAISNNGCRDSITDSVHTRPMPAAGFESDTLLCKGIPLQLNDSTQGGGNYEWIFGDGDTSILPRPVQSYSDTGWYHITLYAITNYGCADTAESDVYVIDTPQVIFTLTPDSACAPVQVTFENNTIGYIDNYLWRLGNGDSTTNFIPDTTTYYQSLITDTVYFISLTASNICASVTNTDSVLVLPTPVAKFGTDVNSGCSPKSIKFNNITTGNATAYLWRFGDSTTSLAEQPGSHVFRTDSLIKSYKITLVASNNCGVDSTDHSVTIYPNTVTAFFNTSITDGCAPLSVDFTDFSKGATFVEYDFGDGNSASVRDTTYIFDSAGTYIVHQYADNRCSYDTTLIQITVNPAPIVSFKKSKPITCEDQKVIFTNTSLGTSGSQWDFGDGKTASTAIATHSYDTAGKYKVRLIALSVGNRCPGIAEDSIEIIAKPRAIISANDTGDCQPFHVKFSNLATSSLYYTWYFDSVNTSAQKDPEFTFIDTGLYYVKLVVSNDLQCLDSSILPIAVYPTPEASFIMSDTSDCDGPTNISFTNTSTNANSYLWDLGNGEISILKNPATIYRNIDTFTISLIASNTWNCYDTAFQNFTIYPQPVAGFLVDSPEGCNPLLVHFTNNSFKAIYYDWDFGDSTTSSVDQPVHLYNIAGSYPIRLIARHGGGCADTADFNDIIVHPTPTADFDFLQTDKPPHGQVVFTNKSTGADSYKWFFGDYSTSDAINPYHNYDRLGDYLVDLNAITDYGCVSSIIKIVPVIHLFNFYIPTAFSPNEDGFNEFFTPVLLNPEDQFEWKIFNRWGEEVFESSKSISWNGRDQRGKMCEDGVYVYVLTIISAADGWKTSTKGQVMLVK